MPRHPHAVADRRSLALHEQVAARLLTDPSVADRARRRVREWRIQASVAPLYVDAWERLLAGPVVAVAEMLRDPGETSAMLRQVSHFAPLNRGRLRIPVETVSVSL